MKPSKTVYLSLMSHNEDIKDVSLIGREIKDTKDVLNIVFNNDVKKTDIVLYIERITRAVFFITSKTNGDSIIKDTESASLEALSKVLSFITGEKRQNEYDRVVESIIKTKTLIGILVVKNLLAEQNAAMLTHAYDRLLTELVRLFPPKELNKLEIELQSQPKEDSTTRESVRIPSHRPIPGAPKMPSMKTQHERQELKDNRKGQIMVLIRRSGGVGIKEVAKEFPGVSEKTIQRELNTLILEGAVSREGERRWSVYKPSV
jgi:hypothetical protein